MGSRLSEASYDIPETYLNLDEATASEPADRDTQHRPSLESQHSSLRGPSREDDDQLPEHQRPANRITSARPDSEAVPRHLNEVSALPPIGPGELSRERLGRYSDDRFKDEKATPTERGDSIWQSPRQKRAARLLVQLCTVSYLVLFAILGTLARLGLQALTTYPGAPASQGVLWANFGGSLVMGFLAEDRRLFFEEQGQRQRQKRSRRSLRLSWWRRDRELVHNSVPYHQTSPQNRPFASAHAAGMYAPRRLEATSDPSRANNGGGQRSDDNDSPPPASILSSSSHTPSLAADEERKRHLAAKKTIPLYVGLSVGFCGSFTSFSSFQRDVFLALSNSAPSLDLGPTASPTSRSGGYSFLALLATLILTPALSLGALRFGAHLAIAADPFLPALPSSFVRRFVDRAVVAVAWIAWLGAVFMAIWPPDRTGGPAAVGPGQQERWRGDAIFALVFAPLGCLARFYLATALNGRVPAFPLGTFAANVGGTLLEAAFYDLQHRPLGTNGVAGGLVGCQVLQGMMDGFCGCLTTVSTWVVELNSLRRGHGYLYGAASLCAGLVGVLAVMGPVRWTGPGFVAPVCAR